MWCRTGVRSLQPLFPPLGGGKSYTLLRRFSNRLERGSRRYFSIKTPTLTVNVISFGSSRSRLICTLRMCVVSPPSSWNPVCFVHSVTTTNQRSPAALVVCSLSGSLMKFMFDDSAVLAEFCTCSSVGGVCGYVRMSPNICSLLMLLLKDPDPSNAVRVYGSVQPLA